MNSTSHGGSVAGLFLPGRTARPGKILLLAKLIVLVATLLATPVLICAQVSGILCTDGEGTFSAKSITGVTVTVDASKAGGLASRLCEATLSSRGKTVDVVEGASQVDIDVMGVNLYHREPIVGIQYKEPGSDRRMTYAIYSLDRTPQLLRTIKGGDFFRTADFGLTGRLEIRTGDAAAADGFDGIPLSSFDFAPTVYLRFEDGKLIDASSEFRPEYDRTIAELKAGLDPASLQAFKSTNGKLDSIYLRPADEIHSLIATKIKILEIVWSYLYSGREAEAWSALNEMWPAADVDRVRDAVTTAMQHGIRAQVDSVSTNAPLLKIRRVLFYETANLSRGDSGTDGRMGHGNSISTNESMSPDDISRKAWIADIDPIPIYLYTALYSECSPGNCPFQRSADILLDLSLDSAGKVVTAKPVDDTLKGAGIGILLKSALSWKFIPAYKDGHPVACKTRQIVSLFR